MGGDKHESVKRIYNGDHIDVTHPLIELIIEFFNLKLWLYN